jgi:hypothetical protein
VVFVWLLEIGDADDATMKPRQRAELVTLLREAASLGLAGLVFGQVVGNRPFSLPLVLIGLAIWFAFASAAMWLAGVDEP